MNTPPVGRSRKIYQGNPESFDPFDSIGEARSFLGHAVALADPAFYGEQAARAEKSPGDDFDAQFKVFNRGLALLNIHGPAVEKLVAPTSWPHHFVDRFFSGEAYENAQVRADIAAERIAHFIEFGE